MAKGRYLVLDSGWTNPQCHLLDTLKEVRAILGAKPTRGSYLIFRADIDGMIVEVGLNGKELR